MLGFWFPERECEDSYDYVDCIEYFDLKSDVFGRTKLPSEPEGGVGRERERDGCLHALYNHNDDDDKGTRRMIRKARNSLISLREEHGPDFMDDWLREHPIEKEKEELFDVWVMEEYGVKESWVKKNTIPIFKSTLEYQRHVYVESLISPVCDERLCDKKKKKKKKKSCRRM